jgi:hypothetical protein
MSRKIISLFLIAGSFFFASCQKDSDIFVPDAGQLNGPDTSWYNTLTSTMPVSQLKSSLALPVYTDSFEVTNNNAYILTPFGLQCGFPPNCCVSNAGQAITGFVHVELIMLKKKGDIIQLNKPTVSNNRLLVSGGEVYVRLTKNGQEVQLAPNVKIQVRFPADIPIQTQMKLFFGDETNPEQFNWLPNTDPVNNTFNITTQNYEIQTNHLHWLGADYFYDTTGISRTMVTATLDPQFTNANTLVYAVLKDYRSVVGMYGDVTNRKFTSIKLPVGKDIIIVVISKQGNDYFMDQKLITTQLPIPNSSTQLVPVKPVITTLANIKAFLGTL